MKIYLIVQYQNERPQILEFNNETEMRKYLSTIGNNITAAAVHYNVFYAKIREHKID